MPLCVEIPEKEDRNAARLHMRSRRGRPLGFDYGDAAAVRLGLEERGLTYVVGIATTTTAQPEAARPHTPPYGGRGPRPRPAHPEPAQTEKKLVVEAGKRAAKPVQWREGSRLDRRTLHR